MRDHTVGFVVDAQTSRIKVTCTYLDDVRRMIQDMKRIRYSVAVVVGPRHLVFRVELLGVSPFHAKFQAAKHAS